jgi:hypothetical protein
MPVQVWATSFPRDGKPQSFIQCLPLEGLDLSARKQNPFHLRIDNNEIGEGSCRGTLQVDGHAISWDLHWRSTFRATLSNKGWIGFSRTPHSDAIFSGKIILDGRSFEGNPLGFGVQGPNCGYRHRNFWIWMHAYFPGSGAADKLPGAIVGFYQQNYADLYAARSQDISEAGQAILAIYNRNVFPDLKVTWGTYPNNLGHMDFPGCFRCHDGSHTTADGNAITQDCGTCHEPLAMDEASPEILKTLGIAEQISKVQKQ